MATFGERFKLLRKEKDLNQEDLINDFNKKYNYSFTKSAVSQYENDKRIPEINALSDFANYFKVTIDYLLGRTDIRTPDLEPQSVDERLRALLSDPEMRVAFYDFESWSEEEKKDLIEYIEFKRSKRQRK